MAGVGTFYRIQRRHFSLAAGQLTQLAVTHFQQAVGMDKVMIVMADGEHRLARFLQPRQQLAIEDAPEVRVLIGRLFIEQQDVTLLRRSQ